LGNNGWRRDFLSRCCLIVVIFMVIAASQTTTAQPINLKDDWGRSVKLNSHPKRVISLSAHLTDMAIKAGMRDQLVAIDMHSHLKDDGNVAVPRLAAYPEPSIENIAKLKPDLILLWGAGLRQTTLNRLEALGIAVFVSEPKTLKDIVSNFDYLLAFSSRLPVNAANEVARYQQLLKPQTFSAKVPVFTQVWSSPLMTIGHKSFVASALEHCGAELILAPLNQTSAVVSAEAVITSAARVVVSSDSAVTRAYWLRRDSQKAGAWSYISLPESALSEPSTKLLDSLTVLCERLDSLR
jgi:iron complex transport system substrate-binding protein